MKAFKIPFTNTPQRFAISLAGKDYILQNVWNGENESWEITMLDGDTEEPIFASMPLVTGTDLLRQYEYLGIGGALYVYTDGDDTAVPTLANLGVESNLYFWVEEA